MNKEIKNHIMFKKKIKEKQINAIMPEYLKYATSVLKEIFSTTEETNRNKLIEYFKEYLKHRQLTVIDYHLSTYGFFDPSVVEFFVPYFIKNHKEVSNNLMSIDEYYEAMEKASGFMLAGTFTG